MKYCKNCGTQLRDDAKFCIKCGQAMGTKSDRVQPPLIIVEPGGKPKGKKSWIGIVIGVLAVVLVLLFIFNPTMRMKGYEKPIYYYTGFVESGDIKSIAKALPVKQIVKFAKDNTDELLKKSGFSLSNLDFRDYKDALNSLDDLIGDYKDEMEDEYGDNLKVEYEIRKAEKIKDLDDIQDKYDNLDIKIKDAYELTIKMKIKGDKDSDSDKVTLNVVKIGGKWYLDIFKMF